MRSSTAIKDYYSILGVSKNASSDEIKIAFRNKVKKYHPDVCKLPNAHEMFVEIGEAYEVLKNTDSRKDYDEARSKQNTPNNSNTYDDFKNTQQKAKAKAESYAGMDIEDLITGVLGFVYELGRTALVGERDKPDITPGDYIKIGFIGLFIIIAIILSFTGIGTIPGIMIIYALFKAMEKDGKSIGIGPLLIGTLIVVAVVIAMLLFLFNKFIV